MTEPSSVTTRKRSRTIARMAATQALYQCDQTRANPESVIVEFIRHRHITPTASFEDGHIPDADLNLLEDIVRNTVSKQDIIDKTLTELLPESWPMGRLDPVLRALLRTGIGEMMTGLPPQVAINEYLDVAHSFFSGDEPKMVNGILDKFARQQGGGQNT
ncbi:transcription antitermination factor NusB [Bombella sp. TMW 2.2559]|uniref:Transcription antitermination protein NusB n=1 Tax=Bombella dulcis TaxID=2967339 RepID=A0ABT3WBV1_9PROT|nr:transcription antitermination factor NusB [Bombella dulcis]MCX5615750.1 transcription antitermination factor NusB [Bombella dulcis]